METNRIRVAAVSYTNTIPFIYGLTHYPGIKERAELILLPPAGCADAFYSGEADVALVPVGAIRSGDLEKLCCRWCLGAEGAVDTVLLLSGSSVDQLKTIRLDTESRTSVLLVKILCRWLWKITPDFVPLTDPTGYNPVRDEGILLIGDKTFGAKARYKCSYDLAEAWHSLTGLPMVFACWLTRDNIGDDFREEFNNALGWGVEHIDDAVAGVSSGNALSYQQIYSYLTERISYHLDDRKRYAIELFARYCTEI